MQTTAIFSIVFYGRSPQLIKREFYLYRSCGFHPPRSFCSDSAVNMNGKDAVLLVLTLDQSVNTKRLKYIHTRLLEFPE